MPTAKCSLPWSGAITVGVWFPREFQLRGFECNGLLTAVVGLIRFPSCQILMRHGKRLSPEVLSVRAMWAGAICMAGKQPLTTQRLCDGCPLPHMRGEHRVPSFILETCMRQASGWRETSAKQCGTIGQLWPANHEHNWHWPAFTREVRALTPIQRRLRCSIPRLRAAITCGLCRATAKCSLPAGPV